MSKYFILDSRSIIGNEALWWRPDSQGYTTNLNEAGVYDESWVKKGLRSTDIPVPVEVARKLAHSSVNADKLAQAGYRKPKEKRMPLRQHCAKCARFIRPAHPDAVCFRCDARP